AVSFPPAPPRRTPSPSRKASDLSMHTVPPATAWGTSSRLAAGPTEKKQRARAPAPSLSGGGASPGGGGGPGGSGGRGVGNRVPDRAGRREGPDVFEPAL